MPIYTSVKQHSPCNLNLPNNTALTGSNLNLIESILTKRSFRPTFNFDQCEASIKWINLFSSAFATRCMLKFSNYNVTKAKELLF